MQLFKHSLGSSPLVEKRASIHPFSPQTIRSATNVSISLGSNENVGQKALNSPGSNGGFSLGFGHQSGLKGSDL
jgi:hypothetical protein